MTEVSTGGPSHGGEIAPYGASPERTSHSDVILEGRLRSALARLNPHLPADALEEAFRRLARPEGSTLEARNRAFRRMLAEGVAVEYRAPGGELRGAQASVFDFARPENNRGMERRNLAVELLRKLLKGEISRRRRRNVVQARSFAEMLEEAVRRYANRAVEAAQVIEELIDLARELREAGARGEELGLSEDELAFYDALETNDSAVRVLGDEALRGIARELVETVRGNVRIDWTMRENVRAHLRRLVKRVLRRHGYPPDRQERATRTVLEQAEAPSAEWVRGVGG